MYKAKDIIQALDIKRGKLRTWQAVGFIKPDIAATGQGAAAEYSLETLHMIALFKELVEKGYKRQDAKQIVETVENHNYWMQGETSRINYIIIEKLTDDKLLVTITKGKRYSAKLQTKESILEITGTDYKETFGRPMDYKKIGFSSVLIINFKRLVIDINNRLNG